MMGNLKGISEMIEQVTKCNCGQDIETYTILKEGLKTEQKRIRLECSVCKTGTWVSRYGAEHIVKEIENPNQRKR